MKRQRQRLRGCVEAEAEAEVGGWEVLRWGGGIHPHLLWYIFSV